MYPYEDRLRAVQLYIKLGKRAGLTVRQGSQHQNRQRLSPAAPWKPHHAGQTFEVFVAGQQLGAVLVCSRINDRIGGCQLVLPMQVGR